MKNFLLTLVLGIVINAEVCAQTLNLTPWPSSVTQESGTLTLPQQWTIDTEGLDSAMTAEATDFAQTMSTLAGMEVSLGSTAPLMTIVQGDETMDDEGYNLTIASSAIAIEARTADGLFYAFQTLRKLLPANICAGVADTDGEYSLPLLTISDAPRFGYRGFMLDVSRHFFTVKEIKKLLRLMATYKMNHFHWHLTDDQGWRVEIKKYPLLTSVGSVRDNSWNTDMNYGQYWTNQVYGPYYYTQEEISEVVDYAAGLHITVVPEIEMPGHLAAAMTAYPEYSCNPNGSHSVWVTGGISTDVLNVADSAAVEFAKDIFSELAPLFPGEVFHIGGDETPTTAWQNNAQCQALYEEEGMTNYSQLQSRFTKQIADHLATLGKRIAVWNEAITASGANTEMVQQSGATVYCWSPCQTGALSAANLGLKAIITNYGTDGCYYINRKANSTDYGAGGGGDNLQKMYNYVPVPASVSTDLQPYYYGVQGTFWCEHVSDTAHLEHLALPRLMGIAETGWTPEAKKNFSSFVDRMKQDTAYLKMANYNYHPQYIEYEGAEPTAETVYPRFSTTTEHYYYQLSSIATTGSRSGRCIELLQSGSALLSQFSGNGAAENMLWTGAAASEGDSNWDCQLWALEADPSGSGLYALVCKASESGSVNPTASAAGTAGRWTYDPDTKYYNFVVGDNGYGTSGDNYYYSLRSNQYSSLWVNCAMFYAVNLYASPSDGQGGYWTFVPTFDDSTATVESLLEEAATLLSNCSTYTSIDEARPGQFSASLAEALRTLINAAGEPSAETLSAALDTLKASMALPVVFESYRVVNTTDNYLGQSLCNDSTASLLHSGLSDARNQWVVKSLNRVEDYSCDIVLCNAATHTFVGAPASSATGRLGNLVGSTSAQVRLTYQPEEGDFTLSSNDYLYYPIDSTSASYPSTVAAAQGAIRPQGTGWLLMPSALTMPSSETFYLNFSEDTTQVRTDRYLSTIAMGDKTLTIPNSNLVYNDMTNECFTVHRGQTVLPVFGYTGHAMQGSVYIDLNRNGQFDVETPAASGVLQPHNELLTFAGLQLENGKYNSAGVALSNLSVVQPPTFVVPDTLENGYYMMRWKVDWNSTDPGGAMVSGNTIIQNGGAVVDILLLVTDEEEDSTYEMIFNDEFNQPDGTLPDPDKWSSSIRYSAAWNRFVTDSPDVAFIRDSCLVCRAIPNPDTSTDNVAMLTGAMETRGKFSFTYGKVEVRLRTNLHTGNFPAAWMMPQPPCDSWPAGGEIDIFESINAENRSYHTVHSNWTYTLGNKNNPKSSFNTQTYVTQWHVYGVEWTENLIRWTIDGTLVGSYARSTDSTTIAQGQWPFEHDFYIILNQSVGNGSWASNPDTSYTYETEFDWVRVYRKKYGDLNVDNRISISDAALLIDILLGNRTDVNGTGNANLDSEAALTVSDVDAIVTQLLEK